MKKDNVPQDKAGFDFIPLAYYVSDDAGDFSIAFSPGWDGTNTSWEDRLAMMRKVVDDARVRVEKGEMSTLYFHMVARRFEPGLLASYLGLWRFQVKRHCKPKVFARLKPQVLQQYADLFGITVDELQKLPAPNEPLPLEKTSTYAAFKAQKAP